MRPPVPARVDATVLGAASVLALAFGGRVAEAPQVVPAPGTPADDGVRAALAGLWQSADGKVRLRLEADGSYERSIAGRARAARGTCRGVGTSLLLCDDTGLRTPITFRGDVIEMAGHDLTRA